MALPKSPSKQHCMPKYSTEVEAWIPPLTVSAAVVDQSLPKPLWWKEEGERETTAAAAAANLLHIMVARRRAEQRGRAVGCVGRWSGRTRTDAGDRRSGSGGGADATRTVAVGRLGYSRSTSLPAVCVCAAADSAPSPPLSPLPQSSLHPLFSTARAV